MTGIDMFTHILPKKYFDALQKVAPSGLPYQDVVKSKNVLWDLDARFRVMDKYEGVTQVLTYATPPLEASAPPEKTADIARIGNEELAEIVAKHPDRFAAGVACLPMSNVDAALVEIDRAIGDLGLKGIMMYTNTNGKPLDSPEFLPIYQKMAHYDLPIWLHPHREETVADYSTETYSKYRLYGSFGWPYETQLAMGRLVGSGVLEKYPNLKFITHHCGGGVPFFANRIVSWFRSRGDPQRDAYLAQLPKPPVEYFRMFYGDTAVNGYTPALMCGFAFFGAEHIVFGSDMPFGAEGGDRSIRQSLKCIGEMTISDADRKKILGDNARRLLHLPS